MEKTTPSRNSLGHALAAIADIAIEQAHDLAVDRLDGWAGRLHDRVAVAPLTSASTSSPTALPPVVLPLIVGVLAGAAVAWWLADQPEDG